MTENGKKLIGRSTIVLIVSSVVCKILGAMFRFPLTNLLGFDGIGVFQMIMSLYSFALVATSGGVAVALSKLISDARAKDEKWKIKIYFKRALLVGVGSGILLGLTFMFGGKAISTFQAIENNKSYLFFIILLPCGSVIAAIRGYFQGYENMLPTAVSQLVEQVVKFAFGLMFAYLFGRFGISEGVFGAFLGIVASELISFVVIFIWFFVKREKVQNRLDVKAKKEFDKTNILLMFSAILLPFANAIEGLVIVPRLMRAGISNANAVKLFGLQSGAVGAILNLPLIVSVSIATTLLPSISFAISKGRSAKGLIEKALKLLILSVLPTTFGLVAISKQMLPLFYVGIDEELLNIAFKLMIYGGFSIAFTALMQFFVMLLQAVGEFGYNLKITSIACVVKVVLTIVLAAVPGVNIFSIVFGNIVLATSICILALYKLKKKIDFSLSFMDLFVLLFSTLSMFFAVYSFMNMNYFSVVANLLVGVLLGVVVYAVFTLPVTTKLLTKKQKV